jgi:hypothetical protein
MGAHLPLEGEVGADNIEQVLVEHDEVGLVAGLDVMLDISYC